MLFDGTYARGATAALLSDTAWLQALLDVEAALARACAAGGSVPAEAAERIAAVCRAERFDLVALAAEGGEHATVVVPLVAALRAAVGPADAPFVHLGATSQDVIDSAAMVLARAALGALLSDADAAVVAARGLTVEHRGTAMVGRTLLQQAVATSFGLRTAGWTTGIDAARAELARVRESGLWVQLGGPVGRGDPRVAALVAAELQLTQPPLAWHAIRIPVARLAGALGTLAGVLGKVARDVTLLAQDELGELREGGPPGRGASTAMAHKRNPVAAVSVLACTRRVPGLVATLLASMEQEHERAAGAWQAEWGALTDLLTLTGSAAAWGRELLERLQVDPARMRENLERGGVGGGASGGGAAGGAAAAETEAALAEAGLSIERALAALDGPPGRR